MQYWTNVGSCETGGGGPPLWNWGALHRHNEGTRYEGGVGFYYGTWEVWAKELHLYFKYPHAYLAPPAVQAYVAQYGLTQHRGYWGCLH